MNDQLPQRERSPMSTNKRWPDVELSPRAIIFERSKQALDTKGAEVFGRVVYVTEDRNMVRKLSSLEAYTAYMLTRLAEEGYSPKRDYICVTGSMLSLCLGLCGVLKKHGTVQLLVYNGSLRDYVVRVFDLNDLDKLMSEGVLSGIVERRL